MIKYKGVSNQFIKDTEYCLKENKYDITIDWSKVRVENGSRVVDLTCNRCKSTYKRPTKNLRKGLLCCFGCVFDEYKRILKNLDYTLIEYIKGGQLCNCLCDICGHKSTVHVASFMMGNRPRCSKCLDIKYAAAADILGFDYISTIKRRRSTNTYCTLRCRKDNHEFDAASGALMKGFVSCRQCQIQTYTDALSKKDCEFVEIVSTGKYGKTRVKYRVSSGHILEATACNILHGKFSPSVTGHWNQKHEVYCCVVEYRGNTFAKIGTANDSIKRIHSLKLDVDKTDIIILGVFEDRFKADALEQMFHDKYKQFNLDRSIPSEFTKSIKKVKLSRGECTKRPDGITEWFSSEIIDDILRYSDINNQTAT